MHALYVCLICMPYMYVFDAKLIRPHRTSRTYPTRHACLITICMPYMYALYVCLICMPYVYALYVCLICMPYMHALYVCLICMPYMYVLGANRIRRRHRHIQQQQPRALVYHTRLLRPGPQHKSFGKNRRTKNEIKT